MTAAGMGPAFWDNLLTGRSFVTHNPLFTPAPGQATAVASVNLEEVIAVARRAPQGADIEHRLRKLKGREPSPLPNRTVYLALAAAQLALEDSGLREQELEARRGDIGVILGNTLGDAASLFEGKASTMYAALNPAHGPAGAICMAHGFRGPTQGVAAACASGNIALINAVDKIRLGESPVMLAGATSAFIHDNTFWESFNRLGVLANRDEEPALLYRAFDEDRDGFVLGEGAALLVLEELEHARARKARIYAELLSYSQRMFPTRMMVDVDEQGYAFIIEEVLRRTGRNPRDLGGSTLYLNLHGTGTKQGDKTELNAIRRVFDDSQLGTAVFASSTKPCLGHTQEASAAIESVICALSLYRGEIPGTPNLRKPIHPGAFLLQEARKVDYELAANLAAGFTGYYAALLFAKYAQ
ncbi:3-oxoacyl-[acyl-carrier-protein] synthase, KASII [Archangium gephyra]|uniref:3-oxoacyl-[acyl-carrier-protein] synthase, KASII n=1 Tax=Archangium gephyra TaxID=48 RepID=A0AAC8TIK8_9BACT|nr:3-oxoacyl-[acyl-carrier-protein] synthase, KASII [Archangium gephyra]